MRRLIQAWAAALLVLIALPAPAPAAAPPSLDALARDVTRAEDVRAIKNLQRAYAQYAQFGLWREMAALFAEGGRWTFDEETVTGRAAIAARLAREGGGREGLAPGAPNLQLIDVPLINLSPDGRSAKGRWHGLDFLGDGKGGASIRGGIYENDYVKQGGVWRIAALHFYPQYAGPYAEGWVNWKGQDLPIVPYHFTPDSAGVPIPAPAGPAPRSGATLAALSARVAALNDEDKVRNLQHAYGYYVDRKMWDDVADLFAEDAVVEIGGGELYRGKGGVRRAIEQRMGPAGLTHGQFNDHPLFDTIVRVAPGGTEAWTRGIELGQLGEADKHEGFWEITVFENRFVKEGGLWKLREMRLFPLLRSDYYQGWGRSQLVDPARARIVPRFLGPNPATGRPVTLAPGQQLAVTAALTAAIRPAAARTFTPAEAARRLAVSTAYDAVENVSNAYQDYLDDFQSPKFAALVARDGFKVSAFAGYYIGRDRVDQAGQLVWGKPPVTRAGISYHWRPQPVILVAPDGRSANLHVRLFQPRTSKAPAQPYAFYGAGFHSGKYHDQFVLEDGIWRFWNLSLDEPYMSSPDWKSGWAGAKDRPIDPNRPPSPLLAKFPPDVPIKALGKRMEHFLGGTGETMQWPQILPMWFDYTNPVSGRVPEHFTPVCVPCDVRPDLALDRHGYLRPPTGPAPDPPPAGR